MAGKSSSKETTLLEITSEWFLDYCIYQLWKEFKEKRSICQFWRDALKDYLLNGRLDIGKELSNKLNCIRFIIGLVERQEDDVCSSQDSSPSDEEDRCEQNDKRLLGPDCLKFFDKITGSGIYPFSNVEKAHMKSSLKLQIILSHYRCGDVKGAENLFSRLYSENGDDEEYQDDLRELLHSENGAFKQTFLRKHTYNKLLNQVQKFFMPAWKKFETPVLEEAPLLENLDEERPKIDAKTLKALYFAWDQSDEVDENWTSIVEGTHLDITALKRRIAKGKSKSSSRSKKEKETSPSIIPQRQVTKSKAEASSTTAMSSVSERIQQCEVVMKDLKTSSKRLFSGLKDKYSDMIAEKAGPSRINDGTDNINNDDDDNNVDDGNEDNEDNCNDDDDDVDDDDRSDQDFIVKRHCKAVVAIPDSPSGSRQHKRGREYLGTRSTKRRYNEEHSDAEEINWASDDDETERKYKTIKLPSPARPRHLNVKLPVLPQRKFWSAEETRWLIEGVKLYGRGNWAKILNKYNFVGRTSANLKDKWRNLQGK